MRKILLLLPIVIFGTFANKLSAQGCSECPGCNQSTLIQCGTLYDQAMSMAGGWLLDSEQACADYADNCLYEHGNYPSEGELAERLAEEPECGGPYSDCMSGSTDSFLSNLEMFTDVFHDCSGDAGCGYTW